MDKCLRGLGRSGTVSEASEIGGVTHPNLMHAVYRLARRTRTNSRVGRWRRSGKKKSQGRKCLKVRGVLEESKNLKKLSKNKDARKLFEPSRFQGKSLFVVPKQRSASAAAAAAALDLDFSEFGQHAPAAGRLTGMEGGNGSEFERAVVVNVSLESMPYGNGEGRCGVDHESLPCGNVVGGLDRESAPCGDYPDVHDMDLEPPTGEDVHDSDESTRLFRKFDGADLATPDVSRARV